MYWSISPILTSTQLMTENCASYNHQKAMAESAVGTIQGSSTTARKKLLNGRFLFSRIARYRPSANLITLATMV